MINIKNKDSLSNYKIVALIPCLNEEATIENTILNFKTACPGIEIYVCDNGSTDRTVAIAKKNGAEVIHEKKRGKGSAVDRLFQTVNADIYVMVDGDNTYNLNTLKNVLTLMVKEKADMIVGVRKAKNLNAFPAGHQFGNKLFNSIIQLCFGRGITDVLSGYRVLSNRFIKNYPNLAQGFDIEVEMSVHALEINCKIIETDIEYFQRPLNSESKLRTFSDGFKILSRILLLLLDNKPILIFLNIALIILLISIGILTPIFIFWLNNGIVPRMPTFILGLILIIISFINLFFGIVLESISRQRKEIKKIIFKNSL